LIKNQSQFSSSLLPFYYKHSNMASFIRQLNMYDFHKVMNVDAGGLKGERDEIEFAHPFFLRGQEHLLEQIKRKVSVNTRGPNQGAIPNVKTEKVNEVLSEVGMLKGRQEDLNGKLAVMRNENAELWQEVENLRQKHCKQERVVNKLIQFLGNMVQPQGNSLKRKLKPSISMLQLAIEEEYSNEKEPKIEFPADEPIIQEVKEENTAVNSWNSLNQEQSKVSEAAVERPWSFPTNKQPIRTEFQPIRTEFQPIRTEYQPIRTEFQPIRTEFQTPTTRPVLQRQITKEDFDVDVLTMQSELDSLKDVIAGQITLDMDTVASLFDGSVDTIPAITNVDNSEFYPDNKIGFHGESSSVPTENIVPTNCITGDIKSSQEPTYSELNTPLVVEELQDPLKQFLKK